MTADIVNLFPKKKPSEITVEVDPLTYWKLRNDLISESFHTFSIHEKQSTLDRVLQMNYELYEKVLELKERLGE